MNAMVRLPRWWAVVAVLLLGSLAVSAQEPAKAKRPPTADRIDLKVALLTQDPFAPANAVTVTRPQFRRGELLTLVITGYLKPSFHTYPMLQHTPDQGTGGLTKLEFGDNPAVIPVGPVREPEAELVKEEDGKTYREYTRSPITWQQDVLILPDAKPGPQALKFTVKIQVCDKSCVTGKHLFDVPFEVSDAPPLKLTPEQEKAVVADKAAREKPKEPPTAVAPAAPGGNPDDPTKRSLFAVLLASMGAAIAMLFTPCVFPMIPITVSFFLKQSEKKHHNALLTAAVYSVTIIVVLALAVLVLGQLIVTLANNAWLNLGLGAVLTFFALSLFGMYEIELPSGLARFTAAREGQGGYLGALFMALTFTITSFTCTGPFLGPLLVSAKEFQLSTTELVLSSFVYAATFAAPFFVLALFPRLLKTLPKSGGWLNGVKVVMGFLELAAALKFLGNTDIALNPGNPMIFNYETILCGWIALSLLCGLYLLGVFRLPHDSPVEHIGVVRMLLASVFIGLALYMIPALWRETPQGIVGRGVVAFLPLDTKPKKATGNGGESAHLDWHLDYQKAWEQAVADNKPIFIDFTGVNCTNCRANENNVFPLADVRNELKKYVRVQMYNDSVPIPGLSKAESERLGDLNREWQENTFRDVTTPLYIIFKPSKDAPFKDGKLNGAELGRFKGYIPEGDVGKFLALLKGPVNGQAALAEPRR